MRRHNAQNTYVSRLIVRNWVTVRLKLVFGLGLGLDLGLG